jgi:hypothetical protein
MKERDESGSTASNAKQANNQSTGTTSEAYARPSRRKTVCMRVVERAVEAACCMKCSDLERPAAIALTFLLRFFSPHRYTSTLQLKA